MIKKNLCRWMLITAFSLFSSSILANNEVQTADYVIVGVGTAGGYLAKALSDNQKNSVIALHNGSNLDHDDVIKYSEHSVFTVAASMLDSPLYDHGESIEQIYANHRKIDWKVGFVLGGGSSINAGAYCLGTKRFYSQWESIAGSQWWSVARIFDTYRQLEHFQGKTTNLGARGNLGLLNVRQEASPSIVSTKFTQAMLSATGLPFLLDYNDPSSSTIGVSSQFQYTQFGTDGTFRGSSSTVFLNQNIITEKGRGVNGRKLQILFNSIAAKVIWQGNKAIGVEFIQNGKVKQVYARKGVIICAGLKSSAFLLRSGIGPKKLLDSLKIPVIFNNANVGQDLQDQILLTLLFSTNSDDSSAMLNDNIEIVQKTLKNDSGIDKYLSHIKPSVATQLPDNPNSLFVQISWLPDPAGDPTVRAFRLATANVVPGFAFVVFDILQPKSRGSITINSKDPFVAPIIDYGIFSNPADLALYVRGLQTYIPALNASLKLIDPKYQLVYPDPNIFKNKNLLSAFVKNEVASNYSFQGHCKMAPLDQGGVVDSQGYVYGAQNLLVADNSIAPVETDGSAMATAYLVAANIARILLNQ